ILKNGAALNKLSSLEERVAQVGAEHDIAGTKATEATAEQTPSPFENFKYVKDQPLNIGPAATDKATATSLRAEYAGAKNAQIVRGNQLADTIRKAVPSELERQGM